MRRFYLLLPFTALLACSKARIDSSQIEQIDLPVQHRLNRAIKLSESRFLVCGGLRFSAASVFISDDTGHTWQYRDLPEAGKGLYATDFYQGKLACAGFDGKLVTSADSGRSWTFTQLAFVPVRCLSLAGSEGALLAGGVSFDDGFLLRGNRKDSLAYQVNDLRIDRGQGIMAGHGVLLHSSDNGSTWQPIDGVNDDDFSAISQLPNGEAWVCGTEGCIYHSGDNGTNWTRQRNGNSPLTAKYRLNGICFSDPNNGIAVGEEGAVLCTSDGGSHWNAYKPFTKEHLLFATMIKPGTWLVGGENGALFRLRLQ